MIVGVLSVLVVCIIGKTSERSVAYKNIDCHGGRNVNDLDFPCDCTDVSTTGRFCEDPLPPGLRIMFVYNFRASLGLEKKHSIIINQARGGWILYNNITNSLIMILDRNKVHWDQKALHAIYLHMKMGLGLVAATTSPHVTNKPTKEPAVNNKTTPLESREKDLPKDFAFKVMVAVFAIFAIYVPISIAIILFQQNKINKKEACSKRNRNTIPIEPQIEQDFKRNCRITEIPVSEVHHKRNECDAQPDYMMPLFDERILDNNAMKSIFDRKNLDQELEGNKALDGTPIEDRIEDGNDVASFLVEEGIAIPELYQITFPEKKTLLKKRRTYSSCL